MIAECAFRKEAGEVSPVSLYSVIRASSGLGGDVVVTSWPAMRNTPIRGEGPVTRVMGRACQARVGRMSARWRTFAEIESAGCWRIATGRPVLCQIKGRCAGGGHETAKGQTGLHGGRWTDVTC